MRPDVSIVITTCNGYALTRWCLESITWTLPKDSYEVIIVDNGSTDETVTLRDRYRFVENEVPSLYESWNRGFAAAASDLVVCTNNDVAFCTRDWAAWLARALEQGEADWVYPELIETQALVPDVYARTRRAEARGDLQFELHRGTIAGCCFAARRALLEEVGPFDPQFAVWYGEKDYEIRLLLARRRYGVVRNAVARHFGASTIRVASSEIETSAGPAVESSSDFDAIARRDYGRFVAKHRATPLASIGLRMPPFGPLPLEARE